MLSLIKNVAFLIGLSLSLCALAQPADPSTEQFILTNLEILASDSKAPVEMQRKAAHAVWYAICPAGLGKLTPAQVAPTLIRVADENPDAQTRAFAIQGLGEIKDVSVVGALTRALKDEDEGARFEACQSLQKLGRLARDAAPALEKGILDGTLPPLGLSALVVIRQRDALDTALALAARKDLSRDWQHEIAATLAHYPDPRGYDFMGRRNDLWAAMFFSHFEDQTALDFMRSRLTYKPGPNTTPADNHDLGESRAIATTYLGRHKDQPSLAVIRELAASDLDPAARTAEAQALGEYRDVQSIPILAAMLKTEDWGMESQGHANGQTHRAAIASLAQIGSDEAIAAVYDALFLRGEYRMGGSNALIYGVAQGTARWWMSEDGCKLAEKFLALDKQRPAADSLAAPIIGTFFDRRKGFALPPDRSAQIKQHFLANVQDKDHFGTDLTQGGRYKVEISYDFSDAGFARVHFAIGNAAPTDPPLMRRGGTGYAILYRRTADHWVPMGMLHRWTAD